MAYVRKGGKGLGGNSGKTYSLRTQFNYYKKGLERQLEREKKMRMAVGDTWGGTGAADTKWQLDYDKVLNKGITKYDHATGKILRYTGEEALKIQIEAMRKGGSKTYQHNQFLTNYEQGMRNTGMDEKSIEKVMKEMRKLSMDKLVVALKTGAVKQISFMYAATSSDSAKDIINHMKANKKYLKESMERVKGNLDDIAKFEREFGPI